MNASKIFKIAIVLVAVFVLIFVLAQRLHQKSDLATNDPQGLLITPIKADDILEIVRKKSGKVTVVNFWATFCGPCVEEFPHFIEARKEFQKEGMELIFVSLDFQSDIEEVRRFLAEQRVDFETFIKKQPDGDFIKAMHPEWSGAIPVTLVYNAKAELKYFIPKALTFEELKEKIMAVLKSNG